MAVVQKARVVLFLENARPPAPAHGPADGINDGDAVERAQGEEQVALLTQPGNRPVDNLKRVGVEDIEPGHAAEQRQAFPFLFQNAPEIVLGIKDLGVDPAQYRERQVLAEEGKKREALLGRPGGSVKDLDILVNDRHTQPEEGDHLLGAGQGVDIAVFGDGNVVMSPHRRLPQDTRRPIQSH